MRTGFRIGGAALLCKEPSESLFFRKAVPIFSLCANVAYRYSEMKKLSLLFHSYSRDIGCFARNFVAAERCSSILTARGRPALASLRGHVHIWRRHNGAHGHLRGKAAYHYRMNHCTLVPGNRTSHKSGNDAESYLHMLWRRQRRPSLLFAVIRQKKKSRRR